MEKWVIRPTAAGDYRKRLAKMLLAPPIPCQCLRIMPYLSAAVAGGTLCGASALRIWLGPGLTALLAWICCRRFSLKPSWLKPAIPGIFILAVIRMSLIIVPAQTYAVLMTGQYFHLEGKVCSVRTGQSGSGCMVIRRADGIRVYLEDVKTVFPYGTFIALEAYGIKPEGQRNPGGFDEAAWLAEQGIYLIAKPVSDLSPVILRMAPTVNLPEMANLFQQWFKTRACRIYGQDEGVLLAGLILGDTRGITDIARVSFRRAGLIHLTSVSGSNIAVFILPLAYLARRGRLNRCVRIWLQLIALIILGFLTGWPISVARAILMAALVLAGQLLHRRADSLNTIAAAAGILIAVWPLAILGAGYWLSLTATASILIFAEPLTTDLHARIPAIPGLILAEPVAAICAQTAVLPWSSRLSREVSLWGLPANLFAGPLAGWITLTAIIHMPMTAIFELLPIPGIQIFIRNLGRPITWGLQVLYHIADYAGRQTTGRISYRLLTPFFWLTWALLLMVIIGKIPEIVGIPPRICRLAYRLVRPSVLAWLISMVIVLIDQPLISVWFLDVGQGDAIIIQSQRQETVMIDGGSPGCGFNILMPALDELGISKIDLAIATHGHADHIGGLIELAETGRMKHLMLPAGLFNQQPGTDMALLCNHLKQALEKSGIQVSELTEDDTIVLGKQIRFDILSAGPGDAETILADENDRSLIMQACLAGRRLLLTADCTQAQENRLLSQGIWPAAEWLKVAHHGSRLATSDEFLQTVRPGQAIISVGPNVFGHPAASVLSKLTGSGCQTFRTDQSGAVRITIDGRDWKNKTMLPELTSAEE